MPLPTNNYHTSTPSGGPLGPVGAGATLWDNWIDIVGGIQSINSSQRVTVPASTSALDELLRPVGEATQDQRIIWTIDQPLTIAGDEIDIYLRRQSSDDFYLLSFDPINFSGQVSVSTKVSGSFTAPTGSFTVTTGTLSSNNVHFATAYNSAHTYTFDVAAYGVSATTLACTVTDVTASSVVCAFTVTDTGSTLQNATGRPGIGIRSGTTSPAIGGSIALYNAASTSSTVTGPNGETTLPSNHNGNITCHVVGTGTSYSSSTTWTPSGVAGWTVASKTFVDATHYTVVLTGPVVASPPAGAVGTLTLTEGVSGSTAATIAIATPTLSASPSTGFAGGSASTTFTGTNTLWQGDNPQFTLSGGTGASIGSATETSDTASSATVTYGSAGATLTITDPSTGAQTTVTVKSDSVTAPSPGSLVANTTGNTVTVTGVNTAWASGTTWSVSGLTGAAVTAKSFTDATHYTLTLTTSTINANGTLTLTNSADGTTCTISVVSSTGSGSPHVSRQLRRWRG